MKRTIALFALGLAACGQPQAPKAEGGAAAPVRPTYTAEQNAAAIATLPAPLNQANYDNGRRVFAQCRSCHLVEAGATTDLFTKPRQKQTEEYITGRFG